MYRYPCTITTLATTPTAPKGSFSIGASFHSTAQSLNSTIQHLKQRHRESRRTLRRDMLCSGPPSHASLTGGARDPESLLSNCNPSLETSFAISSSFVSPSTSIPTSHHLRNNSAVSLRQSDVLTSPLASVGSRRRISIINSTQSA